ncbi:MAG: NDP-sugar synthase [Candidatus Spechtbacterales bacterium]
MKAIILAGGRATRLPESAKDIPKALVEVGGKPILLHQIDQLQKHGFFDIRLALGYRAEQIVSYVEGKLQQSVDYVIEREPLDTGGAIKFASKDLGEPFLALNGDILSDINFKNFYARFQKRPEENIMAVHHTPDARSYGIIKKRGGRVVEFLEKPSDKVPGHINAGFYILRPTIFENMKEKRFSMEKDIFPHLAARGKLGYYIHRGFWTDAGTEQRLAEARAYLKGGIL